MVHIPRLADISRDGEGEGAEKIEEEEEDDDEEAMETFISPALDFDTEEIAPPANPVPRPVASVASVGGNTSDDKLIQFLTSQAEEAKRLAAEKDRRLDLVMQQMAEQNKMFKERLLQQSPAPATAQSAKTKAITEPDMQDETWWTKGDFTIEDNKQDKLDLDLRIRFGAVNQDPKIWFPKISQSLACITTPRRASTVYTGN